MPKRVFVTVGEVSGDLHAGQLIAQLRALAPDILIEGHGGQHMRAAGAIIHHDTTRRAAMGLAALGRTLEVVRLLRRTRRHFQQDPPDLQICCDSWSMNRHFARLARRFGRPVLYYIAPQTWASREGRVRSMRRLIDRLACILPFEEPYFRAHGLEATFVGHPLFDELPSERPRPSPRFPDRPPVIGLLAGSRASVARHNFPRLLDVAAQLRVNFPEASFVTPTTATTDSLVRSLASDFAGLAVRQDAFDELVAGCDLCITVSGTAALHTAAWGVPLIVVYHGNPLLWHLLGRWVIAARTYSLVNILAEGSARVAPEFIPWYGSTKPVADEAARLLRNPQELECQHQRLLQVIAPIARPGASLRAAQLALGMLQAPKPSGAVPGAAAAT